jgi:hypothetical protein
LEESSNKTKERSKRIGCFISVSIPIVEHQEYGANNKQGHVLKNVIQIRETVLDMKYWQTQKRKNQNEDKYR